MLSNKIAIYALTLIVYLYFLATTSYASSAASQLYGAGGRLEQVELAVKAANRGGSVFAVRSDRHIVVLSWMNDRPKYELKKSKIRKLSKSVAVTYSGVFADGQYIVDKLHKNQLSHQYVFGCDMPIGRLAKECSDFIHQHTTSTSYRPFGVRCCLFSYDEATKKTFLYEIDPYGYLHDCQSICFGPHNEKLPSLWYGSQKESSADSLNDLIKSAISSLRHCLSDTGLDQPLKSDDLDICVLGENINFKTLDNKIIEKLLLSDDANVSENDLI